RPLRVEDRRAVLGPDLVLRGDREDALAEQEDVAVEGAVDVGRRRARRAWRQPGPQVAQARRALEEPSREFRAHLVHLAARARDDDAGRPAHDTLTAGETAATRRAPRLPSQPSRERRRSSTRATRERACCRESARRSDRESRRSRTGRTAASPTESDGRRTP